MKKNIIQKVKDEAGKYGVPFWKLPDFLILIMALVNIIGMICTYYLALNFVNDPRTAVIFVAIESAIILIVGHTLAESSRRIMVNYKLKEEFIDLISHQIRSPVTNAKWNLEFLSQKKMSQDQRKYVDRLTDSIEKVISLVNDFVYLSRLEQSANKMTSQKVDIKKLIEQVTRDMRVFASSKKIKVKITSDFKEKEVKGDSKKLKVIINNIFENALKYSQEKGEVIIDSYKHKNNLIIKVSDSGCGIEVESQPFVFDKFYRSARAKELSADGTGVGLYVSRAFLEKMGGEIWFESKKDKGTTFYISLPMY